MAPEGSACVTRRYTAPLDSFVAYSIMLLKLLPGAPDLPDWARQRYEGKTLPMRPEHWGCELRDGDYVWRIPVEFWEIETRTQTFPDPSGPPVYI